MSTSTNSVNQEQQPAVQTPTQPLIEAASPAPTGVAGVESTVQVHQEAAASSETSSCCGLGDLISRFFAAIGDCFRAVLDWLCCRGEEDVQQEDPLVAHDPNDAGHAEELDVEGRNALHEACLSVDVVNTKLIVARAEVGLNDADSHGEVPLHIACDKMSNQLVLSLLMGQSTLKKARVDVQDKDGRTPLHRLCLATVSTDAMNGGLPGKIFEKLALEPNFQVDVPDKEGRRPLHYAAQTGKADLVEKLLEMRANAKTQDKDKRQPLHLAAMYGQAEIVPILVRAGVDVNARDKEHCTPILLVGRNLMHIHDVPRLATGRALAKEGARLTVGFPDPQGGGKMLGLDETFRVRLQLPTTPKRDERSEYTATGTLIQTPSKQA